MRKIKKYIASILCVSMVILSIVPYYGNTNITDFVDDENDINYSDIDAEEFYDATESESIEENDEEQLNGEEIEAVCDEEQILEDNIDNEDEEEKAVEDEIEKIDDTVDGNECDEVIIEKENATEKEDNIENEKELDENEIEKWMILRLKKN